MKKISKEHVLLLHHILIKYSGGCHQSTFRYTSLCNAIQGKAAKLCFDLDKNHPFIDRNATIVHQLKTA